jgi:hypothetical protein
LHVSQIELTCSHRVLFTLYLYPRRNCASVKEMLQTRLARPLLAGVMLLSLLTLVFASPTGLIVNISQHRTDNNLTARVTLNVNCNMVTSADSLTISVQLYGPDGRMLGNSGPQVYNVVCGHAFYNFVFSGVLSQSGFYTISATVSLGSLVVTATHSFDPNSGGGEGPL